MLLLILKFIKKKDISNLRNFLLVHYRKQLLNDKYNMVPELLLPNGSQPYLDSTLFFICILFIETGSFYLLLAVLEHI